MKFENLDKLIVNDIKNNNVPMLVGEPGIGKSSWVEGLADKLGTRCFVLAVNQLADKADLTGCRLVPTGKKNRNGEDDYMQVFYPHTIIRQAIDYAEAHPDETPILFLDEINRTTPDVTSEALSIPTARSIGDHRIPDNLKVMIAGNDKGNVSSLDKASITRFVLYHIEPDVATFFNVNKDLNPYVRAVLKKNPAYIYTESVIAGTGDNDNDDVFEVEFDDSMEQISTPRTITSVSRWLNGFSYEELRELLETTSGETNLLQEALVAHCGNTPFTMAVLEEILKSNLIPVTQSTLSIPSEPAKYKVIKNIGTRAEAVDYIFKMSEAEKSEMLVYLLYDKTDNQEIISIIAPAITSLQPKDVSMITNLSANHGLDKSNLDALLGQNCLIVRLLRMLNL